MEVVEKMPTREQLIEVFQDTMDWCRRDPALTSSIQKASGQSAVYIEGRTPPLPYYDAKSAKKMEVSVTTERSFEAAMRVQKTYPNAKIAVHNFASAVNPGGGVTIGAGAQEECLCRCSTLYPVLAQPRMMHGFYYFHREEKDFRYTDRCIYSPGIQVIKSDIAIPQRLDRNNWIKVDVITCAAPNLSTSIKPHSAMLSDYELLDIHIKRAFHMLSVVAANGADTVILGAFGCGAFQNNPEVVAKAYKTVLPSFESIFKRVVFAVYCPPSQILNYQIFSSAFTAR